MFDALEVGLEAIGALRGPLAVLRGRNVDLYHQVRRAGASMTLNLAEGRRRVGKDRKHLWRVAMGSADEVRVALRTAVEFGDLEACELSRSLELLDREVAMLWKMTR
jgi:four helix bundle protein